LAHEAGKRQKVAEAGIGTKHTRVEGMRRRRDEGGTDTRGEKRGVKTKTGNQFN